MPQDQALAFFKAILADDQKLGPARYIAQHLAKVKLHELTGEVALEVNVYSLLMAMHEYARTAQMPFVVVEALRTFARQDALYQQGRTTTGPIVTHAMAGQSYHNYALAFDITFADNPAQDIQSQRLAILGAWWEKVGGVWGGEFNDYGHFEYHPGWDWQDLIEFFS